MRGLKGGSRGKGGGGNNSGGVREEHARIDAHLAAHSDNKGRGGGKAGRSGCNGAVAAYVKHGGYGYGKGNKSAKARAGETMIMGGVTLVAVEKEGRLVWEPTECADSFAYHDSHKQVHVEVTLGWGALCAAY